MIRYDVKNKIMQCHDIIDIVNLSYHHVIAPFLTIDLGEFFLNLKQVNFFKSIVQ